VLITVAVIFGALLVALAYVAFDRFSQGRVRYAVLSYRVLSDHKVQVSFEVHKDPNSSVVCRLRALDRNGAEVGSGEVRVGPGHSDAVTAVGTLTTTRRAATGDVSACVAVTPSPSPSGP
jgi:hypothetical protein